MAKNTVVFQVSVIDHRLMPSSEEVQEWVQDQYEQTIRAASENQANSTLATKASLLCDQPEK